MINMPEIAKSFPKQCVCHDTYEGLCCECGIYERSLRAFMYGKQPDYMSDAQREECLNEIAQVEGYDRKDYEDAADEDLAQGVLDAWTDYARDKGLL